MAWNKKIQAALAAAIEEEEKKKKSGSSNKVNTAAKNLVTATAKAATTGAQTGALAARSSTPSAKAAQKKVLQQAAILGAVEQTKASGAPVTPAKQTATVLPTVSSATLPYADAVRKYFQQGLAFAQQGPKSRQQIADELLGFDIGDYDRGDISNLSMEILSQLGQRNAYYINQHRDQGTFDEPQFLKGEYISLPSKGFLDTQYPLIGAELEKSRQKDEEAKIFESNLQSTRGAWEQLEMEKNNPYMFDPMYGYAMMEYLQGNREEPFNFDQWDYDYQNLSAAEQQERLAKLQEQWNALDFDTLTGRDYKPYQSQTPELEAQYNLIGKEIDKREAADKQSAMLRSHPSYGTPYVAPESKTFPMPSVDQNGNWTFGTYDSNMYDELYLMHSGLSYADLYTAAQNNPKVKWYLDEGLNYMLPEEIAEYKVAKEIGDEEATAWLRNNRSKFLLRRAMVMEEWTKTKAGNPWLALPSYIDARINNLANVLNVPRQVAEAWLGIDDPNSPAFDQMNKSAWTGEEHLDIINDMEAWEPLKKAVGYAYQGTTSAVDNFTRLAASGFNPTASLIIAGLQSGSASLHESADRDDVSGAAKIIKAIGTGAIEVGTEKIGLDAFFDKGQKNAVNYIKQVFLSELGEEELNALSEPVLEAVVAYLFDHEAEIKSGPEFWQELTDTAITTAISSLLMGGGGAITQSIDNRQTGKAIQQQGDPEAMLEIGKAMPKDSDAYAIAVDIEGTVGKGKKLPLGKLGKLTQAIGQNLSEEYKGTVDRVMEDAITERLVELGTDSSKARKNAPVIRKLTQGEKLTAAERAAVAWDDNADQVTREISRDMAQDKVRVEGAAPAAPEGQRTGQKWVTDMRIRQVEATGENTGKAIRYRQAMERPVTKAAKEAAKAGEAKVNRGKTGKPAGKPTAKKVYFDDGTSKGEGDILRFEKDKDGLKMVVQTGKTDKDTATVSLDAMTSADGAGTAAIISYLADTGKHTHDISAEEANTMLAAYNVSGGDVARFIDDYTTAYLEGYSGLEGSESGMGKEIVNVARTNGQREAEQDETRRKERASAYKAVANPVAAWLGRVDSNAQVKGQGDVEGLGAALEDLTESQRVTAEAAIEFCKAVGLNVVLFESNPENVEGIQNGSFDAITHTVYLDVNSGTGSTQDIQAQKNAGTLGYAMGRTLSHELTHYLEVAAPEAYAKYSQAVKAALKAKGQDFAMLMREKMDRAIQNGRKLTMQGAAAEVIADASEYMLQDSKFTNNLDSTVKGKIKAFIQNFTQKVKDIFRNLTGGHKESAALREMKDGVYHYMEGLQDLWDAGFVEILDKGTEDLSAGDTESVEGQEVQYSIRDSAGNDITLSSEEIEQNKKSISQMSSVSEANGNSYVDLDGADYRRAVQGYFAGVGKTFDNPVIGTVRITTSGLKHLTRYKSKLKSALVPCVKDVIENGMIVDVDDNHDLRGEPTVVLAAPVTLDGKGYYMGVAVRQANNLDKMYHIHEAALIEQEKGDHPATKTEPLEAEPSPDDHPSIYSILDSIRKYNRNIPDGEKNLEGRQYSTRDLPDGITIRDYLRDLKPTSRMNETEKYLLKKYQEQLQVLEEKEQLVAQQEEIIRTAPFRNEDGSLNDEITKAKNRYKIYRDQANRAARALTAYERDDGFANILATGRQVVNELQMGSAGGIADAADVLEKDVAELTAKLTKLEADVTRTATGQRNAYARGLYKPDDLKAAAQQLKDSYGSRMSVNNIADRLALTFGELYANDGAEGAKMFSAAAKDLAIDLLRGNKFRYKSEILPMLREKIGSISLSETDVQEIENRGYTLREFKSMLSPYIKVTEGASDLSSFATNAQYYGEGALAAVLNDDTEGNLAMRLYEVISQEKAKEAEIAYEGMTENQLIGMAMADIAGANLPMSTNNQTVEYLRKELMKYAGENATVAIAVEEAIGKAKTTTAKAGNVWREAVKHTETARAAVEYYRKLEEKRRVLELAEQKKSLTEQLRSDNAQKLKEKVDKQKAEYRAREQKAREYRKTRDEVDKLRRGISRKVKRLNTLRVRETDQKHVPQELQHVADLVMQTFTDSELGRLAFHEAKLLNLGRTYRLLMQSKSDAAYFWDDEIEVDIENLKSLSEAYGALRNRENGAPSRFSLEGVELETEILQGVDAIVSNVLNMIDSTNTAFLYKRNETFEQYANKTGEKLLAHADRKTLKGVAGKMQEMLDETLVKGNTTPVYFFEHLDNPEIMDVFDEIRKGMRQAAIIEREGKQFIEKARKQYKYGSWVADGKLTMKTGQGHTIELTREEAAEIYAIAKREKNNKLYQTEHLLYGGFQYKHRDQHVSEDGKTLVKDMPHQLDMADIAKIESWLTAEQKAYADELVGFLSTTMADYGNEASMDMYGYKKFTESYYIPFHTVANQRFQKGDEGPQGENAGTGRVKNSGFTHKVQHGANAALYVGGLTETVADHIHKMAAYSAMVQPIENMKRLLNHKVLENDGTVNTIRALIGQKYGKASEDYMTQLLKDLNGATQSDQRAAALTDKLVGAFKRGAVMASASVVLQQPTAMTRAMAMISPKYFAQNPFYRPSKGTWDEMLKHSGTAVIKDMGKFDVGMGLTASQYILDENLSVMEAYQRLKGESKTKAGKAAYDRFMAWLTAAPGVADQWTWGLIWKAVKAEQADLHPEMDHTSKAFLDMVGERFDDVVDHTQVYDSVMSRSNLMRSTDSGAKAITAFRSEPTLSLNMLFDALMGWKNKKLTGGQALRIIGSVWVSQVLAGAMAALVQAWNDDDDKRSALEKYADRATGNILDNLNPLGMIPIVSEVIDIFSGYDIQRPDMEVINDVISYGKSYFAKISDPSKVLTWKDHENFIGTMANLLGLPAKNISREIRRTWNAVFNTDWSAPSAFSVGQAMKENLIWYSDKKTEYYQRIVTAELRGETELADNLRTYMLASKGTDEDDLTEGIRDAYKERYEDGGIEKDDAITFLMEHNLVTGETEEKRKQSAFQYVDKWEEGTTNYSAYNTLKDAYKAISFSDIQNAWKELTNYGYTDEQVKTQSRTLIKELVKDGSLTTGQATQLLRKWCSYKKDSDNVSKPQEWLKDKK